VFNILHFAFFIQLDAQLALVLNGAFRNPLFDVAMPFLDRNVNWMGPLLLVWLGVMIWGGKRGRIAGVLAVVVVILTDQISSGLVKPLVERIRPCNVIPGLHYWSKEGWIVIPDVIEVVYKRSFSFPSSHAANSMGQALWWALFYPAGRWWYLGGALVIGYSRIYIGVHYPGDVIGGWIIGAVSFGIVWWVGSKAGWVRNPNPNGARFAA